MKKKIISALLCASMVASMVAGCGSKAETDGGSNAAKDLAFMPEEQSLILY